MATKPAIAHRADAALQKASQAGMKSTQAGPRPAGTAMKSSHTKKTSANAARAAAPIRAFFSRLPLAPMASKISSLRLGVLDGPDHGLAQMVLGDAQYTRG